ncbi:MAG: lytic transglycosylase domain-containing protein [Elusimicrobiota bacterium]
MIQNVMPCLTRNLSILLLTCYLLLSTVYLLNARQGTLILKNGNKINGEITVTEKGDYMVETRKYSMLFLQNEINSVKYSTTKSKDTSKSFVKKMKNTKKQSSNRPTPDSSRGLQSPNYDYDLLIHIYADKYNIDPAFVKAVMEAESNFNPNDVSSKGAVGLMQLMPQTAKGLNVDPENTEQNIEGGVKYLNYLLQKFDNSVLALAAYNAGPNAVKKYSKKGGGIPPYNETQTYIENVLRNYQKHKSDKQFWYFVDEKGCLRISDNPKDKRYKRLER